MGYKEDLEEVQKALLHDEMMSVFFCHSERVSVDRIICKEAEEYLTERGWKVAYEEGRTYVGVRPGEKLEIE